MISNILNCKNFFSIFCSDLIKIVHAVGLQRTLKNTNAIRLLWFVKQQIEKTFIRKAFELLEIGTLWSQKAKIKFPTLTYLTKLPYISDRKLSSRWFAAKLEKEQSQFGCYDLVSLQLQKLSFEKRLNYVFANLQKSIFKRSVDFLFTFDQNCSCCWFVVNFKKQKRFLVATISIAANCKNSHLKSVWTMCSRITKINFSSDQKLIMCSQLTNSSIFCANLSQVGQAVGLQ